MYNSRALECAICKGFMSANDIYYTPCSHTFDYACITEWLKSSSTCPQCRQPVVADQLRRMYINLSSDTSLQDELLNNQKRIATLKLQIQIKNLEIMEYKDQLNVRNNKVSNAKTEGKVSKREFNDLQRRVTRSSTQAAKSAAAGKDSTAIVANLKNEMKAKIDAVQKKMQETTQKFKLEHEKNLQLKKDLQLCKRENRVQQRILKEIGKFISPSVMLKKSQTFAKLNESAVEIAKKTTEDAQVDSPNRYQAIATRTRSRIMK